MTETDTFRASIHLVSDGPDLVRVHLGQEMRHASAAEARQLAADLLDAADNIDPQGPCGQESGDGRVCEKPSGHGGNHRYQSE